MKKIIVSLVSLIILAILGLLGLKYLGSGPRERVKSPDGSKVTVEEISYYIRGSKVFGKLFRPDDGEISARRPLVVYFHEPLKTDFPENLLKAIVPSGLAGYSNGFRGKDSDAVAVVKRLAKEDFVESDMVFLVGDSATCDAVLLAASRLGHRIQGLVLIEPNPTGKAREIYQVYGKEFLTIDASGKADAVRLIEDYLEERGALK